MIIQSKIFSDTFSGIIIKIQEMNPWCLKVPSLASFFNSFLLLANQLDIICAVTFSLSVSSLPAKIDKHFLKFSIYAYGDWYIFTSTIHHAQFWMNQYLDVYLLDTIKMLFVSTVFL